MLHGHQHKSIQTDRIRLIPGPREEIDLIRRIYRDYIHRRKSERQISDDLNAEGLRFDGRPWSRNLVRTILSNEKYVGNNVFGRFSQRLRSPQVMNPPDQWIRRSGAFQPIVASEIFHAAAQVRRFNEKTYQSREAILKGLKVLLKREGKLTTALINGAPELPSVNTVIHRFGSLGQAYIQVGYKPPGRYGYHAVDRALDAVGNEVAAELIRCLRAIGVDCHRESTGLIVISSSCTLELVRSRNQRPSAHKQGWRIAFQRNLGASVLIALRFRESNDGVRDLLVVPRADLEKIPRFLRIEDDVLLAPYRHKSVKSAARCVASMAE